MTHAAYNQVRQFNRTFRNQEPRPSMGKLAYDAEERMRLGLMAEEVCELVDACAVNSLDGTIDALADIVYVSYGFLQYFGYRPDFNLFQMRLFKDDSGNFVDAYILIQEELVRCTSAYCTGLEVTLCDSVYGMIRLAYVAAASLGFDLSVAISEVHRSNMTKLSEDGKPIYREDGKILKSYLYEPPNLAGVLHYKVDDPLYPPTYAWHYNNYSEVL